ncbi:MAG TPA: hypothetical protein VK493_06010 [Bryobacteraceae bacterium]|nr:hypothetical protein [Bryobacteraceae bacterium]
MTNKLKCGGLALPIFSLALILTSGCGTQPIHPNQLNTFDGATYDTLTLAHGALGSLRAQISAGYPKYVPQFNQAASAYDVAFQAYSLYRTDLNNQSQLSLAVANLTVSVVALESVFQSDMNAAPAAVANVHGRAKKMRATARVSISDILTELEIAAAVARTIAPAAPYALLAELVIRATSQAVAAQSAASGHAIDLTTIAPIPAIA